MHILIFFIYAILASVSSRKVYDVEEEAMKLYGEDFNAVLLRFRKTPEYLNILQDKVKGMQEDVGYLSAQVRDYFLNEMYDKILKTLGVTSVAASSASLRSKLYQQNPLYATFHKNIRQGDDPEKKAPPVSRLDHYPKLHHAVSTANLNYFKARGFEFAGRTIHTIIKHMGGDDSTSRSTMQPFGDQDYKAKTTTEHDRNHQVQPSPDSNLNVTPETPAESEEAGAAPPDSLRYSYRNKATPH